MPNQGPFLAQPFRRVGPTVLRRPHRPPATVGDLCYRSTTILDSPTAYYRLGETAGTAAIDEMGGASGTYTGGFTLGVASSLNGDPDNASITLNGSSGYVVTGTGWLLGTLANASVTARIKTTTTFDQPIYCERTAAGNNIWKFLLSGGRLKFEHRNDAGTFDSVSDTGTPLLTDNRWHDVAMVKTGVKIDLYVDDLFVYTQNLAGTDTLTNASPERRIGADKGDAGIWFNGSVDEVALYSAALTATRINARINAVFVGCINRATSYSATLSDALGFGDSVDRSASSFLRTMTDALTLGNAVVRVGTFLRTATDALGFGDAVVRILAAGRTATDSLTLGNTVARVATLARTASDSLTFSDAVTRVGTFLRTASDSLSFADSVSGIRTIVRTVADSLGFSDAVTRTGTFIRTTADSLSIGNTVARVGTFARTASDSLSFADAVAGVRLIIRTATDALSFSDAVTRVATLSRTASDSLSIGNTVTRVLSAARTAADGLGFSDAVTRTLTLFRTAADSLGISSVVSAIGGAGSTVIGGFPPIASAISFISNALGRNPVPGGSAGNSTPGGEATNPTPKAD